ncbi:MAG: thioredoxin [Magnetococcales bacterium]|nr:thioredoxin [Magnetococcales bacterium]
MATVELTKDNFEGIIADHGLVIIDFWAAWCGPCQAFGPIFEQVSERFPDAVFAKVNTDQERELAGTFGIQSIPTLMIFRDKIIIYSQPGMLPAKALVELVTKARELDMDEVRREIAASQSGAASPAH